MGLHEERSIDQDSSHDHASTNRLLDRGYQSLCLVD